MYRDASWNRKFRPTTGIYEWDNICSVMSLSSNFEAPKQHFNLTWKLIFHVLYIIIYYYSNAIIINHMTHKTRIFNYSVEQIFQNIIHIANMDLMVQKIIWIHVCICAYSCVCAQTCAHVHAFTFVPVWTIVDIYYWPQGAMLEHIIRILPASPFITMVRLMKPTAVGFIRYVRRRSDRIWTTRFLW